MDAATPIKKNFTIMKAESNLSVDEVRYTKSFGEKEFSMEVAHTGDGLLSFTVEESKDAAGQEVANDKVITVDATGKVKLTGIGSAKVVVALGEGSNYKETTSVTVEIIVNKYQAPKKTTLEKTYLTETGAQGSSKSINLKELLPADAGKITYALAEENTSFIKNISFAENGTMTFSTKDGVDGDSTTLKIKATSEYYEDAIIEVTVFVVDRFAIKQTIGKEVAIKGTNQLT